MSTNTAIEWADAPRRVRMAAAARIGVTLDVYDQRRASGNKWCCACKSWRPVGEFDADRSRGDGRSSRCQPCKRASSRADYQPRPRPAAGRRFVAARDGDALQARRRVNHLVDVGLLPDPNTLPCLDCGHRYADGERRHEYDHHLGYDAAHHEDVEPVCTTCHHTREDLRRTA